MRFQRNVTLLLDEWRLVVAELDVGAEVVGGAWSSMMPQRSGEHCATLGEHLREAATAHLASTCYHDLSEHLLGEHLRAPLLGEHPSIERSF